MALEERPTSSVGRSQSGCSSGGVGTRGGARPRDGVYHRRLRRRCVDLRDCTVDHGADYLRAHLDASRPSLGARPSTVDGLSFLKKRGRSSGAPVSCWSLFLGSPPVCGRAG